MRTADLRRQFISFFKSQDHEAVTSSSLVPQNDPTLMFTNAGMVQFKNVFTGAEKRPYTRAVSSQKCVRAGGKHNDLDNVGYTARHHTFFEMLGNFSFGDYFKEDAIDMAWRFVTGELGLSADKLLVTVFHTDDEAFDLWRRVAGLSDDRIIRIPTSDNFWSMGDVGPCGPCSEIFYDHGEDVPGGPPGSPDEDGDRFIEIWNLVFMQYDQLDKETRRDLPKPSIDTGMGLERVAAILQGKHDNYDIDLFQALTRRSAELSGAPFEGSARMSHRVLADHIRSCAFLLADGVMPSNEGRGYVLRRIMRRGMRHAHLLGASEPLMHRLVPTLIEQMGDAFPELLRAHALITDTLNREEIRFRTMLERGLSLLEDASRDLSEGDELSGQTAFKLYDTYGFPLDLTEDALRAKGVSVDTAGFDAAMEAQKAEARAAWAGSGESASDAVMLELQQDVEATEFLGYEADVAMGRIQALLREGNRVEGAAPGEDVQLVANQTAFYGESGGQQGDMGRITWDGGSARVRDTKKVGGLIIHHATVEDGSVAVGADVRFEPDINRRKRLRANHSATHLLHEALRRTLGDHVSQKGSLVAQDRLRFDFSHSEPMTTEQIRTVEDEVNRFIQQNEAVITRVMAPDDAVESGALALFGEKYGDEVRVLFMGEDRGGRNGHFSIEFCGGTHVSRLGDIGAFKILSESAVSSGVRRIEAVTGIDVLIYMRSQEDLLATSAQALKVTPSDLPDRITAMVHERKGLEKALSEARKSLALSGGNASSPAEEIETIGSLNFIAKVLNDIPAKDLRGIADEAKKTVESGVVLIIAINAGKASIVTGVTPDLTDKVDAVALVRAASQSVGGKGGGGRPDLAQAGGPDGNNAHKAVDAVREALAAL